MRIAIETSSLFPLFVYTPYTNVLYEELGKIKNKGGEIICHSDSIEEARQISIFQKTKEIVSFTEKSHADNKLSFLRAILEYFPGNMYGNNSSRAVALFVLDVLDSIPKDLPFNQFKILLGDKLNSKISDIEGLLNPLASDLLADYNKIHSYWNPQNIIINRTKIDIKVRINKDKPISTKNHDRDLFHYELAISDGDIDEMIVCDGGFVKQIPEVSRKKLPVKMLKRHVKSK